MIDPLTDKEKKRIDAFRCRNIEISRIAADITLGRNLLAYVQITGQVDAYLEEEEEDEKSRKK